MPSCRQRRPSLRYRWADCKNLIRSHFPIIYDTKVLASEYCLRSNPRNRTHLAAVYQQAMGSNPQWEQMFGPDNTVYNDGLSPYEAADQEHDAAFDAYMTGIAFCGLSYTYVHPSAL